MGISATISSKVVEIKSCFEHLFSVLTTKRFLKKFVPGLWQKMVTSSMKLLVPLYTCIVDYWFVSSLLNLPAIAETTFWSRSFSLYLLIGLLGKRRSAMSKLVLSWRPLNLWELLPSQDSTKPHLRFLKAEYKTKLFIMDCEKYFSGEAIKCKA